MTQPDDSSRTPEPRSYSPSVPIPDRRRLDRASDGALDCATCSVVGLVGGLFLAAVAVLSWTALSLAFDEPVAVAPVAYEKTTMAHMLWLATPIDVDIRKVRSMDVVFVILRAKASPRAASFDHPVGAQQQRRRYS
jgi:hypothetical protein